jgi:transaldolase/glucose-6-phosphate isomerase
VRQLDWITPANTIFIVASKSGTTVETLSLFRHFWSRVTEAIDEPGAHFIAISDPGTKLVQLARERAFRAVFEAPSDVGGRFSALTAFGLVPAGLMGVDVLALLEAAREAADVCREDAADNPGARLGAILAEEAGAGRDKVTFVTSPEWAAFPDWAEQLIAESTGKAGRGIVPVAHEPPLAPDAYASDRLFVGIGPSAQAIAEAREWGDFDDAPERLDALGAAGHPVVRIRLDRPEDIGGLFFVWEVAVSLAGAAMGINPFDQPDVEIAKELARRAMEQGVGGEDIDPDRVLDLAWDVPPYGHAAAGTQPDADAGALLARVERMLGEVEPGDYVAIQAYLAGGDEDELDALQRLRAAITGTTGAATTLGYGPRFLHSTGQLHKGGPNNGVFLQLVDDAGPHVHVPEETFTFHQLIQAQALGDLGALVERGRRVLRVRMTPDDRGISRLQQLVDRSDLER